MIIKSGVIYEFKTYSDYQYYYNDRDNNFFYMFNYFRKPLNFKLRFFRRIFFTNNSSNN